jgi:hypothetical protein
MSRVVCPGCGLALETPETGFDAKFHASFACLQLYWELSAFTLTIGEPDFIHQLAVDSYAAQHAAPDTKPIRTAFALMGLCLTFERGFTGREVQLAHMEMGKSRTEWPVLRPPPLTSMITLQDVLNDDLPSNYKDALRKWSMSVWGYWKPEHERIRRLLQDYFDPSINRQGHHRL